MSAPRSTAARDYCNGVRHDPSYNLRDATLTMLTKEKHSAFRHQATTVTAISCSKIAGQYKSPSNADLDERRLLSCELLECEERSSVKARLLKARAPAVGQHHAYYILCSMQESPELLHHATSDSTMHGGGPA